jgi:hypothetical protein
MFHRRDRHDHPLDWPFFFPLAKKKIKSFGQYFQTTKGKR